MILKDSRIDTGLGVNFKGHVLAEETQIHRVTVEIQNTNGLHARPAYAFVDIANQFNSSVSVSVEQVRKDDEGQEQRFTETVDGKSIMAMLTLGATKGTSLDIQAEGEDAQSALEKLVDLVNRKFDEE